jgi:putative transposase
MNYNPHLDHRQSIRLNGYDYSKSNWYFITICCSNKKLYFKKETKLKQIVTEEWLNIPKKFTNIELDQYMIMPNHIHGIIFLNVGAQFIVPNESGFDKSGFDKSGFDKSGFDKSGFDKSNPYYSIVNNPMMLNKTTLGKIIRYFKAKTTYQIRNVTIYKNFKWQRNYFERIIRDENELNKIRQYIIENPLKWEDDKYHPKNIRVI